MAQSEALPHSGEQHIVCEVELMADRLQEVLSRKGTEQAVQRPRVSPDGTIMLTDLPVDLRASRNVASL